MNKSFSENSFEITTEFITAELNRYLRIGYRARYQLKSKFEYLLLFGHDRPLDRIGEIIQEFDHWLQYTFPDDTVGFYFYEDLISTAIKYWSSDLSRGFPVSFDYPVLLK